MNDIELDAQSEEIRGFLMTLSADHSETALKMNGLVVAYVIPAPAKNGRADDSWSDAKNDRRCDLIDKKHHGDAMSPEEVFELARLQEEASRHVDRVAPRPLAAARRLHQELLIKADRNLKP